MPIFSRYMPHILPVLLASEGIRVIIQLCDTHHIPVRFVGGAVRDALLGRPITDIDLATPLLPAVILSLLQAHGLQVVPTGIAHGTVTVYYHKQPVEITTLRRDVACDGRRATVAFTDDWQADAARRDFTINALSCSPEGDVYDYFGGIEDLEQGIVRFVGQADARIQEDYLRILRFFRFSAYYGTPPFDQQALQACRHYAYKLTTLSGERIQREMLRILCAPDPAFTLAMMQEQQLLPVIFPVTADVAPLAQLVMIEARYHIAASALRHIAVLLRNSTGEQPERATALLARQWKLSRKQHATIHALLEPDAWFMPDMPVAMQKKRLRRLGRAVYEDSVLLSWAEYGRSKDAAFHAMFMLPTFWEVPAFPVNGSDLQAIGFAKGKRLGEILAQLEHKWEEEGYTTSREALLAHARH